MQNTYQFNVRVYGLLVNQNNQLLLSDEQEQGMRFTKFPGGGLEYGEGLKECLKREFLEECNADIEVSEHFYTTDFYIKSAFNDSQIISIYYFVKPVGEFKIQVKQKPFDFDGAGNTLQAFRWKDIPELSIEDTTFPTDQKVIELLKEQWRKI